MKPFNFIIYEKYHPHRLIGISFLKYNITGMTKIGWSLVFYLYKKYKCFTNIPIKFLL